MTAPIGIALCGLAPAVASRITGWLEQHPALGLQVAFATPDTESLLERLAHQPVHGVVLNGELGLEGLSFAQELLTAGYRTILLTRGQDRPHLRQRAGELGVALCPDSEPARLAALLRGLMGLPGVSGAAGRITTFHSPRGGAGTTSLLLHLARTLRGRGRPVAVVEVGGGGGAVPLLGLRPGGGWADLPPHLGLDLVGHPEGPLLVSRALVEAAPGLHLLPSGGPTVMDEVGADQVEAMLHLLAASGHGHVLVDTPAELTLPTAAALAAAHDIVLISLPDPVSAFRLIQVQEVLTGLQVEPERVQPVVNRVRESIPQRLGEVLQFLQYRPPLRIPEEPKPTVDGSGLFAGFRPGSGAARAIDRLLDHLVMEVRDR